MRALLPLAMSFPLTPAAAWEFSADPICTLSHETPEVALTVTFDPALPEYAITLTLTGAPWPNAPVFAIAYDGEVPLMIQTDRHVLSDDGQTLTVTDTGFGNVLDGLEFNSEAMAFAGNRRVLIPLDDADPAVEAFRACPATTLS
jgi:hypothetical protein